MPHLPSRRTRSKCFGKQIQVFIFRFDDKVAGVINETPSSIDLCCGKSVAKTLWPYQVRNVKCILTAVVDESPSIITADASKTVAKKTALLKISLNNDLSPEINETKSPVG